MQRVTLPSGLSAIVSLGRNENLSARRPPILFVHGMMAGAWQFERVQPYFARLGYESQAIDLRGHHASRPVRGLARVSVLDYVDDALDAARALGRPIVVGQSMGGLIAQKLAEAGAVTAAVLVCSVPPRGIRWASAIEWRGMLRYVLAVLCARPLLPHRAQLEALIFNRIPAAERALFFERQVPESSRAFREIALGTIRVDAAKVRCPVLSVTTGEDRAVLPSVGRQLARKYGGTLLHFDGYGHYALVGEPGWAHVAGEIARWLEATLPDHADRSSTHLTGSGGA